MQNKELFPGEPPASLYISTVEFPDGIEFLVFEKDGRFREGKDTLRILDKYISKIPSSWVSYPDSIKRVLYSMDRLGLMPETFYGQVNYYFIYWIKIEINESQLTLYFTESGSPERWSLKSEGK